MLPNVGPVELMLIMAIALIFFGPKKLPEIGRGIGQALREFNRARNDFMNTLHQEMEEERSYSPAARESDFESGVPAAEGTVPSGKTIEYPEPLDAASADALPYGSDFYAAEGDSQPAFRTTQPEPPPAPAAATASAPTPAGDGRD